jgi:hypothetical protein
VLFDHPTLGDVQSHAYLEGKILKVYLEDAGNPAEKWDTADVEYESHKVYYNAPVRYHCQKTGIERSNGAVADGGRGFDVGDRVILLAKISSSHGRGDEYEKIYVVGHIGGAVPCSYNYLFIRISASELKPHAPPYGAWNGGVYVKNAENDHPGEFCTVWDPAMGAPAKIYNPITSQPYVFPVSVEEFKPAFDFFSFIDEELFTLDSQGDQQSQEAGFIPNWLSDVQGNKIRCGAAPDAWWTTYDIYANPIFSFLFKAQIALASDNVGAMTGTFAAAMTKLDAEKKNIAKWKEASPQALNDDTREFDVTGSEPTREITPEVQARLQTLQKTIADMDDAIGYIDSAKIARWESLTAMVAEGSDLSSALRVELVALSTDPRILKYRSLKKLKDAAVAERDSLLGQSAFTPWVIAHDKDGKLLKGKSYHVQTAYGEDEIWVCGKNIYQGLVISACDAAWKFVRFPLFPPFLPIGNSGAERLMGTPYVPSLATLGMPSVLENVSHMLATDTMIRDDNNIFSYGTLKRINDGGFHRTSHPALKSAGVGSYRMTQAAIPGTPMEPIFKTALNSRSEHIDIWSRYDNWMNSILYSSASWGVDRTWWFTSSAMQWRIKATFIDTPIGSMWHASPVWEVGMWNMLGFHIANGGPTCRRDAPIKTRFTRQTKHSKRTIAQIYIVQRQGLTMWDDPARTFVLQEPNKGIYDHFAPEDIKYVDAQGDGKNDDDYTKLTSEEQAALLSDRVCLRSQYAGEVGYTPPVALRLNRNEIEIMAACDLYSALKTKHGRMHPNDQTRNGLLEYEIQKLIERHYTNEALGPKALSEFKLEARIV